MQNKNGFSLIESLVVIAILALLVSSYSLLKYLPSAKTNAFLNELRQDILDSKTQAKIQKIPRILIFNPDKYSVYRDENYSSVYEPANDTLVFEKRYQDKMSVNAALTSIPKTNLKYYILFTPKGDMSDNSSKSGTASGDISFLLNGENLDSKINIGVGGYVKVKQ